MYFVYIGKIYPAFIRVWEKLQNTRDIVPGVPLSGHGNRQTDRSVWKSSNGVLLRYIIARDVWNRGMNWSKDFLAAFLSSQFSREKKYLLWIFELIVSFTRPNISSKLWCTTCMMKGQDATVALMLLLIIETISEPDSGVQRGRLSFGWRTSTYRFLNSLRIINKERQK